VRSRFLANWCPPMLRTALNRAIGSHTRYVGPFADWAQASANAAGYDEAAILQRVVEATQRALCHGSGYEQDGVFRDHVAPPGYVLAALMLAAACDGGRLSVVDFGGALGSHYLRWRALLGVLPELHWCIVEQAKFVVAGTQLFASTPAVAFRDDVGEAREFEPNAVLASSALQYLEKGSEILSALIDLNPKVIVLDRTPFDAGPRDQILVQHVPASLGRASYPLRTFARPSFESRLQTRYDKALEFPSGDAPVRINGVSADYLGQIWVRRS